MAEEEGAVGGEAAVSHEEATPGLSVQDEANIPFIDEDVSDITFVQNVRMWASSVDNLRGENKPFLASHIAFSFVKELILTEAFQCMLAFVSVFAFFTSFFLVNEIKSFFKSPTVNHSLKAEFQIRYIRHWHFRKSLNFSSVILTARIMSAGVNSGDYLLHSIQYSVIS